jgi:hypothetical protein
VESKKAQAVIELKHLVEQIDQRCPQCVGIGLDNVDGFQVGTYRNKGYEKPLVARNCKDIEFAQIESTAPEHLSHVRYHLKQIIDSLEDKEKPNYRKIKQIITYLGQYGSWANLIYNLLHNAQII